MPETREELENLIHDIFESRIRKFADDMPPARVPVSVWVTIIGLLFSIAGALGGMVWHEATFAAEQRSETGRIIPQAMVQMELRWNERLTNEMAMRQEKLDGARREVQANLDQFTQRLNALVRVCCPKGSEGTLWKFPSEQFCECVRRTMLDSQ